MRVQALCASDNTELQGTRWRERLDPGVGGSPIKITGCSLEI